jgi:Protein of unknown function (DUF3298)/Deacetylase PdaC
MKFFKTSKFVGTVVLLIAVTGCRKTAAPTAQAPAATQPAPGEQQYHHPEGGSATSMTQTKYFKGSIGSTLGLQMKLVRDGDSLAGNYFYQKVGTKIDLKGTVDKEGNLALEEFDSSGKPTGVFKGIWKTDEDGLINLAGNWSKPNSEKKTAFSIHEEPIEISGGAEIVAKAIKETNKKLKYEIDAEYPQVVGAADGRFDKFNQEVRSLITSKIAEFKKQMSEKQAEEAATTETEAMSSDLGAGYTVGLAKDDLVSVEFDIGGYYQGAAHPNSYTQVINYDVKNGKVLKLADLFKPGAKYLQAISSYSIKNLTALSKSKDSMLTDETINSGAGPEAKNYRSWTITKKGLGITFDSYQVGPYVAGPQRVVIPYSALKDIIRPDGPLGEFVK